MLKRDLARKSKLGRLVGEACNCDRIVKDVMKPAQFSRLWKDCQAGFHQPKIVTLSGPEHHPMLTQGHRFRIAVDGDMLHGKKSHVESLCRYILRPIAASSSMRES